MVGLLLLDFLLFCDSMEHTATQRGLPCLIIPYTVIGSEHVRRPPRDPTFKLLRISPAFCVYSRSIYSIIYEIVQRKLLSIGSRLDPTSDRALENRR